MALNAFTCSGGFAELIFSGIKKIENRCSMPIPASVICGVSVSRKFSVREHDSVTTWVERLGVGVERYDWDLVKNWRGHIIGWVRYCATLNRPVSGEYAVQCRMWDEGLPVWWILAEPCLLRTPIPCKGALGMWRMDEESEEIVMDNFIAHGQLKLG